MGKTETTVRVRGPKAGAKAKRERIAIYVALERYITDRNERLAAVDACIAAMSGDISIDD